MTKLKIAATAVFLLSMSLLFAPLALADPVDDVVAANQIPNRDLIYVGQVLTIPGSTDSYTVVAGDTLTNIMAAHPGPVTVQAAAVAPMPAPAPPIAPEASQPVSAPPVHESVNWDAIAQCESGGNWAIHTANGYEGGVQFLPSTWRSVMSSDDPPHAYQATREQQIAAAERLLARSGIGQWPVCGHRG